MRLLLTLSAPLACLSLLTTGCSKSEASPQPGEAAAPLAAAAAGPITVVADGNGFTPSQIKVSKGKEVTLNFQRKSDDTCATEVVFPDLNIKKPLPLGQVVAITIPTTEAKTFTFTCGMGMFKSAVVVN